MSRKQRSPTPENVTNDMMSKGTCWKGLRLKLSPLSSNTQVELVFTIIIN